MTEHNANRTLLKSPPELWSECSDAASLARHLGAFGEIRITKLEPETTVAWEGAAASGTVRLEPAGWGTRVTLTATSAPAESEPEVAAGPEEPVEPAVADADDAEPVRTSRLGRLLGRLWRRPAPASVDAPIDEEEQAAASESESSASAPPESSVSAPAKSSAPGEPEPDPDAVALSAALDSLGRAHHRPFSRA